MGQILTAFLSIVGTIIALYSVYLLTDINSDLSIRLVERNFGSARDWVVIVDNNGPAAARDVGVYLRVNSCPRRLSGSSYIAGESGAQIETLREVDFFTDWSLPRDVQLPLENAFLEWCIERRGVLPFDKFVATGSIILVRAGDRKVKILPSRESDERSLLSGAACAPAYSRPCPPAPAVPAIKMPSNVPDRAG